MPSLNNRKQTAFAVGVATLLSALPAAAYEVGDPWSATALDPFRPTDSTGKPLEGPVRLTWHVVADGVLVEESFTGTTVPNQGKSFLDATFGTHPTGTNPIIQPWYSPFDSSFGRIEALSGIDFQHEIFDDGAPVSFSSPGSYTTRADIRIAGLPLTDISGDENTLAYNYGPTFGDMVINTNKAEHIGDPTNNFRNARNLFTHEILHGVGIKHNDFNEQALMYPVALDTFDGPQFDDIAALHQLYNDASDRANAGLSTPEHIIPINGQTAFDLGMDAGDTQLVTPDQTDFVSVTNQDKDYFQFTLDEQGDLIFVFNPVGPTYEFGIGAGGSAKHVGLLSLRLYDQAGQEVFEDTADNLGESIGFLGQLGAGTYNIELASSSTFQNTTQMYQFAFRYVPEPTSLALLGLGTLLIARRRA